ncbi:MAG TPA: tetratricopeptide repeat protein, partial [Isosphaeraceae bacterium]|nr:tetratricopeptide repeat protein [Isosphaeraceae bacterium]
MEPRDVHARRWRRLRDVGVSLILSVTVAAVRAQGPARKDAARARHSPPWQRVLTGDDAQRVKALEKTVDELEKQGQFAEAMAPAREGLAIRQRVQGEDHWQTIEARITVQTWQRVAGLPPGDQSDLAAALRQQEEADQLYEKGRYAELEPLVRTIWEVHRRILGAEHPYTAVRANNLAAYLRARGRYAEAEPLLEQVLAIRRKTLGREHPFTALSCNNLAMVLEAQGKFAESEHLFQEALAIRRQTLGDDHPVTASSYDNLAYNWHALGKLAEAEPLLRKALTIRRKALGEDHPLLAYSYNNLAANLDARGKSAEAEPLFQRALEIRRKVLGEDHPDTASSYENLAINRHYQGKSAEAEPLLQQALRIRLKVLGADHPDTAQSYSELAAHLDDRRKYAEAEPLHQRALAIRRTRLGEGHPKTALSYHNLALSLDDRGQHSQAGRLFGQALAIRRKALGEDHPDTARSYSSLAANLHSQGKFAEADVMAIAAAGSFEAARPRISFTGMDRAEFSARSSPLPLLAALLVRQGRDQDAWQRWESGLARGLFDDLTARRRRPLTPEERGRQEDLIGQLNRLDNQIGALAAASTPADDQLKRLDSLKDRRLELQGRLAQFEAGLVQKYKVAAGAVYSLDPIQTRLPADAALVGWLDLRTLPQSSDPRGDHWACVVRRSGTPRWVRIPGTGPNQAWTAADDQQPGQVRALLGRSDVPPCQAPLAAMAAQRLAPLEPTLSARDDLPAVRHLIVLPSPALAGVPVEALLAARPSEAPNYLVSYAPSGTLFAWLQERR